MTRKKVNREGILNQDELKKLITCREISNIQGIIIVKIRVLNTIIVAKELEILNQEKVSKKKHGDIERSPIKHMTMKMNGIYKYHLRRGLINNLSQKKK